MSVSYPRHIVKEQAYVGLLLSKKVIFLFSCICTQSVDLMEKFLFRVYYFIIIYNDNLYIYI